MKKVLLLALGVMMTASSSYGHRPFIGLYTDNLGQVCTLDDMYAGLCSVYLVQTFMPVSDWGPYSISAELRIDASAASPSWSAPIGTIWNQPVAIVPDGETVFTAGVRLGFGQCKRPPIRLGTFAYFCQGLSAPCEYLQVVPFVGKPEIVVEDCALPSPNVVVSDGGVLTINDNGECFPAALCYDPTTPVEKTSWGQIKALYRD